MFGSAILAAALIRLILGLSGAPNALNAYFSAGSDAAIIAHFTEFTIALFPLLWVYCLGSSRARYVVMAFALIRLGGFVFAFDGQFGLALIEPICIVVGVAAMLSTPSTAWVEGWEDRDETFG